MESRKAQDVVVIGAGVNGCGAAYHLAREGYKVAVVEQGMIAGEASGRNAGGIRQNGRSKAELPLAMNAIRQWMHFRDELGGEFEYVQTGNVLAGYTEKQQQDMAKDAQRQRDQGLDIHHITDQKVIREMVPALNHEVTCINFVATDGKAQPFKATWYLAKLAKQQGATFCTFTKATRLVRTDEAITGVETNKGFIPTRSVIVASGPWAISLLQDIGIKLPMLVRRTQACITTPMPHFIDQWLTSGTIWAHQTVSGNVMIGGGGPWEPLSFTKESSLPSLQRFCRRAQQVVPGLKNARLLRGWGGCLDVTPDFQLLVDKIKEIEGLVIALGTCGHGFALGPAVGQACAEMATGRTPSVPVEGLALSRFPAELDFEKTYKATPEPL
jgi:sarcosine oxidase subunit beta